ncbi:MAG: hypothetical protein O9326_20850 [Microcystis sp. LE19-338.1B]|nr:hypothetical protein [Microcystis sp. LE19-338.1B]MCZ8359272.1 hypothetical protein [Microcystis sp. LE19-388.1G]
MAHLKTKATTGKLPEREQWKWRLIRGLYEKEFEREQIIKLFEIIDNMMTLSTKLQSSLDSKINQFEEARLGEVPLDVEQYLNKVSVLSTLQEIVKLAATANSLAEFKQSLAKIQS